VPIRKRALPASQPNRPWRASWPAERGRVELAPEVAEDVERNLEHLASHQVEQPEQRIAEIIGALDVL
jgi:hypothetical protein